MLTHEEILKVLEEVERVLSYISDEEEKKCGSSQNATACMFHRGRQLMAIDINKIVQSIFRNPPYEVIASAH